MPRRIYSEIFGIVNSSLDLLNSVPNIAYCALISLEVSFEEKDALETPLPILIYKLFKLVKPYRFVNKNSLICRAVS